MRDPNAIVEAEKQAYDLGKKLVQSIRGEHAYPEQEELLRQRKDYFRQLITWNKDRWPHEYEWWVQMGWIEEGR